MNSETWREIYTVSGLNAQFTVLTSIENPCVLFCYHSIIMLS